MAGCRVTDAIFGATSHSFCVNQSSGNITELPEYKTHLLEISFNLLWNRMGKNMPGLGSGSGNSCAEQGVWAMWMSPFQKPQQTHLELGPLASLQLFWLSDSWGSEFWALGFLSAEICPSAAWWAAAWVCVTSQHLKLAGFVAYNSWFSLDLSVYVASLFLQEHHLNLCMPKESMKLQIHPLTFA